MFKGRIIKALSGFYYVKVDNSDYIYACKARGIFRKESITPLVGDYVKISVTDEGDMEGVVEEIFDRHSELVRPPIANIDLVVIVFALKNPNPNINLLDRFIVLSERENLKVSIVFNKIDIDKKDIFSNYKEIYTKVGYKVFGVSADKNIGIEELREEIREKISVFAGPSGAGKSSLLNAIDPNINMKTGQVSKKIGRGRHTTRHAELVEFSGGLIADTPGFSSLSLSDIESIELKEYFREFKDVDGCRFGNKCIHENEPGCKVKELVESGEISEDRYKSYIQLLNEIREVENRRYR